MTKEYIIRDEMIEQTKARVVLGAPKFNTGLAAAIEVATNIPAADVVEVVRCGDCKYRDYDDAPYGKKVAVCTGAMAYSQTPDDWYCPMGERKDEGQDE